MFYFIAAGVKCHVAAVKCPPPYFTIVQIVCLFLLDHWAHSGYFENQLSHKLALVEGMEMGVGWGLGLIKPSLWFSSFCVFFVSKCDLLDLYLPYCIWCQVTSCRRKTSPVLHQIIFLFSLGSLSPFWLLWKYRLERCCVCVCVCVCV